MDEWQFGLDGNPNARESSEYFLLFIFVEFQSFHVLNGDQYLRRETRSPPVGDQTERGIEWKLIYCCHVVIYYPHVINKESPILRVILLNGAFRDCSLSSEVTSY